MPHGYLRQFKLLFARLAICYLFYTLSRIVFYLVNRPYFQGGFPDLANDLFWGLWFDSFSIAAGNLPFMLLSLVPPALFAKRWYKVTLKWTFAVSNSVFLAFNFIDVAYYPFTRKRSTTDLFKQLGGQSDIYSLLPQFLKDYWWLFLLFGMLIAFMTFLYRKTEKQKSTDESIKERKAIIISLLLTIPFLAFLAIRGGLSRSPIDIVNAGAVTAPERAPVVLNTPFTIIKTIGQKPLPEYHFFKEDELKKIYDPIHHFDSLHQKKLNVVVLLLESFSKVYCGLGNRQSYTPFFDSLMQHSLVFTNAIANSSKSIDGVPSVLSGIPSYMELPYINSMYANNSQTSFASLLGAEGYKTAFFHGGSNGTMNFVEWSAAADYDHYYGRNEYNNEEDFDGYWGIWDEPFLQFAAREMSTFEEPFHGAIFTLSSHHPYVLPEKYRKVFPKGRDDFEAALRYADYSLKRFFETAQKMAWYKNTLFVLVADHAIILKKFMLEEPMANHTIPVAFFRPDNSLKGKNGAVFFQTDILTQAMYLLGYNKPFFSFGKDPSKTKDHIGCYYGDGHYSVFTDSMLMNFIGPDLHGVYNYRRDTALRHPIKGKHPELEALVQKNFRALLQTYNHTLNTNSGIVR